MKEKQGTFAEGVYFILRTGFLDITANGEASINALNNGPIKDCVTKSLFTLQKVMTENLR